MNAKIDSLQPDRFDGRVIIDARDEPDFEEAMFTPAYWEDREAVVGSAGGRGQVLFVDQGDKHWVLRHYHRGGAMRTPLEDRYFWAGVERTRSLAEFRILADMYAEDLPVPRPVAARYVREGWYYRADLITERIPGARSLAEVVAERIPVAEEWVAIGICIRRFHDAGVDHADLNAHNILLGEKENEVYILDFDRGSRRGSGHWKKSNLRRLNRSLHKIGLSLSAPEFEESQWPALLYGYGI